MALPPADPDKFGQAIRAFRKRVPMTDAQFRALSEAEQEYAFTVAGVTQGNQVQSIFDAIDRAIEDGTTLEDFKAEAGDVLAEAWGGEDAPRVESLFRTNVLQSYNEGRHEIFSDPVVREARPYLRFDAVGDSRACDICDPLDGKVLAADDPFWAQHQPPLHPNCRCLVTPLDADEAHDEGISRGEPRSEPPADGFGGQADYEPDLGDFDPEIAAVLRDRLR